MMRSLLRYATVAGLLLGLYSLAQAQILSPIVNFGHRAPAPSGDCSSVSGNVLWLDASDGATIISSGGSVSQWNDKSGNANNATQATSGNQPTIQTAAQNGLNTLRFTAASSQAMSLASSINLISTGYTAVSVVRHGGPSGTNTVDILDNSLNTTDFLLAWYIDEKVYSSGTAQYTMSSAAQSSTAYNQVSTDSSGSANDIYFNGSSVATTSTSSSTSTMIVDRIGSSELGFMNGEVAEVCLYNSVLSTGDRQKVEGYMKAKWATP